MRATANRLTMPALRRIALVPAGNLYWKDLNALDGLRATTWRVAMADSWAAQHPLYGGESMIHYLPHAGYVLNAAGLRPSRVHHVRLSLDLPSRMGDEDLLTAAHLSVVTCFKFFALHRLHVRHGWTMRELLTWSLEYGKDHYRACKNVGIGDDELIAMLRAGQVPTVEQVSVMAALLAAPEPSALG